MHRQSSNRAALLNWRPSTGKSPLSRKLLAALFLFTLGCAATFNGQAAENAPLARLPFELRRGHVMVPATIQGTNKLSLLLDTGYGMTMLHPEVVNTAKLSATGRNLTIVGIAGEEPARSFEGPLFDFAGITWQPRRIAALSSDGNSRSRRRDGVLGAGFFRRFVVRIDPKLKTIELLEPASFNYAGKGDVLPLNFKSSTPSINAAVQLNATNETTAAFEIDTGCDGALCIGRHFTVEHNLDGGPHTPGARVGVGGSQRIKESRLVRIKLGRFAIENPEANLFIEGSPVDPPLAGHIGWELLKNFRVIFDYSRKRMILEQDE